MRNIFLLFSVKKTCSRSFKMILEQKNNVSDIFWKKVESGKYKSKWQKNTNFFFQKLGPQTPCDTGRIYLSHVTWLGYI